MSPGVALTPRGQLVRVASAQSAALDDWLAANDAQVDERQGTPPSRSLILYVVLRYREGLTDTVPIPGEPCRTEDQVMVPSRIQDDYKLELRLDPPVQTEEDALRDFTKWLRGHIQPVSGAGTPLADFLSAIRQAVVVSVPQGSPADYLNDTSPPAPIPVPDGELERYLRAALRLWVTELRARWRPASLGTAPTDLLSAEELHSQDAVLLAKLELPLVRFPGGGPWKIHTMPGVRIDEESRPFLASVRLLQEVLLTGDLLAPVPTVSSASSLAASAAPAQPDYRVAAAGLIPADPASPPRSYNGLRATRVEAGRVGFTFDGFVPGDEGAYVVKAMLASAKGLKAPCVTFGGLDETGFILEVSDQGKPLSPSVLRGLRFVLEVCHFSPPAR